jgi:hypothetical protein
LAAVFVRRGVAGKRSRAPGTVSSASPSRPGAGHGLACTGVYFALGPLFGGWPWIGQPPFLNFLCFYLTHFLLRAFFVLGGCSRGLGASNTPHLSVLC